MVHKPLPSGGCYLFSVDVEDVQDRLPSGDRFGKRAGLMLSKYLEFLDRQKMKATFFVVFGLFSFFSSTLCLFEQFSFVRVLGHFCLRRGLTAAKA